MSEIDNKIGRLEGSMEHVEKTVDDINSQMKKLSSEFIILHTYKGQIADATNNIENLEARMVKIEKWIYAASAFLGVLILFKRQIFDLITEVIK